jgi:hypothetical protein
MATGTRRSRGQPQGEARKTPHAEEIRSEASDFDCVVSTSPRLHVRNERQKGEEEKEGGASQWGG